MTIKNSQKLSTCFLLVVLLNTISCSNKEQKEVLVTSPDRNYTLSFNLNNIQKPSYTLTYKDSEIIKKSSIGIEFKDDNNLTKDFHIEHVETKNIESNWKPIYGEKKEYPDNYRETLIKLSGEGVQYNFRIRAYNEGIAFRYEFHNDENKIHIKNELTEFSFPDETNAWTSKSTQSKITKIPLSKISASVERPLLVQLPNSLFAAIGEAGLDNYASMKFSLKKDDPKTLVSTLSSEVIGDSLSHTPWRFIMAANKPGRLLENNYLVLNLSEPNEILDTSWIKPGKVIRETTLTTQGGMACVDFAAKHNLQFIEFDAGWYGNEYDESSDATTITVDPMRSKGPLDLLGIIKYAKSKDIGVILYVNRRALEKQLDEILPLFKSWGVSGIKYGFVNVGEQKWTNWLHDAIRKAAKYNIMIDVHDEYRPTGYSRTYPNFMTQEGVRGDEESPNNTMVIKTLFTRMIAGAADHTNCYFTPRVTEKMGSHVSQLAKAVCVYSPWQFLYWYDRPQDSKKDELGAGGTKAFIQEVPELAFFDKLPTVWDNTIVIDGYPGEYAIVARKSNTDWFVGALTGDNKKELEISLDFLDKEKIYEATIYTDDEKSNTVTKVAIEKKQVTFKDEIRHTLLTQNGLAVYIKEL